MAINGFSSKSPIAYWESDIPDFEKEGFTERKLKEIQEFCSRKLAKDTLFHRHADLLDQISNTVNRQTIEEMLEAKVEPLYQEQQKAIMAVYNSIFVHSSKDLPKDWLGEWDRFTKELNTRLPSTFEKINKQFINEVTSVLPLNLNGRCKERIDLRHRLAVKNMKLPRSGGVAGEYREVKLSLWEFRDLIKLVIQCANSKGVSIEEVTNEEAIKFGEMLREQLAEELIRSEEEAKIKPINVQKAKPAHTLIANKLYVPSTYELHERVLRWKAAGLEEVRGFTDKGPNKTPIELYRKKDDKELEYIRACHNLCGVEKIFELGAHDFYTFKTNKGFAALAEMQFNEEAEFGLVTFGINNKVIYHRHFRKISEFKDLKTILEDQEAYEIISEGPKTTLEKAPVKKNKKKKEYQFSVSELDLSITITYNKNLLVKIFPIKNRNA